MDPTSEFYETYRATVVALAETWILDAVVEKCKLKDRRHDVPETIFEWEPSDSFFLDADTNSVVIVQKEDECTVEFWYNPVDKTITEKKHGDYQVIYSKSNTFNVGRAVKTKTFRDYLIKRINDCNLNAFLTVNQADITVTPKRFNSRPVAAYSQQSATREMPKICEYITTKSAVKLLKTKLSSGESQ